jgi:hypothetical protein
MIRIVLATAIALALASCNRAEPTEPAQPEQPIRDAGAAAPPETASEPASPSPAAAAAPAFVDKVWKVKASSAVAIDTTYTFLSDGTLVIDAQQGTPGYGQWTYVDGALTMIEEGQSYPTDILQLDDRTFEIRSNNPGGAVTITLVPAEGAPLPSGPAQ